MKLKRIIYFGYYVKTLDWKKFKKFLNYTKEQTGKCGLSICWNIFKDSIKYNVSIVDYFVFNFWKSTEEEKGTWAGTGYMYEYQLFMNPRKFRSYLEDKAVFDKMYGKFMHHMAIPVEDLETKTSLAEQLLANRSGKIFFKNRGGNCGKNTGVTATKGLTPQTLVQYMKTNHYDMAEEFVEQHEDISKLAPTALNTVRIFTQLRPDNTVDILGCRLRISVHGITDNLAGGNVAAVIDPETGIIIGKGVYSDITKTDEEFHPVTNLRIPGTQIPYWQECLALVREAALVNTDNRSIGWDLAITSNGPDLIEGNREWCKLLYQLPLKKGRKSVLDGYRKMYQNDLRTSTFCKG